MRKNAPNGSGTVMTNGYRMCMVAGVKKLAHVRVAEKAIGCPMPKGAVVHHINGNKLDNRAENLVVCPDASYHRLLHRRMDALTACGNANFRKCSYCLKYDSPANMYVHTNGAWHRTCNTKHKRLSRLNMNRNSTSQENQN